MAVAHAAATGLLTLLLVTSRQFGIIPEAPDADHATPSEWPNMLFKHMGAPSGLGGLARLRGGQASGDETVAGADSDKQWKLEPFRRGRPEMATGGEVERTLKSGNVFSTQSLVGNCAMGKAVMDVKASPRVVWDQILDFGSYPNKVPKVSRCEVYERSGGDGGGGLRRFGLSRTGGFQSGGAANAADEQGATLANYNPAKKQGAMPVASFGMPKGAMPGRVERIKAKFVSPVCPGVKFTFHVDHSYEPSKNSITWSLDRRKKNDFEDIQGHWHVEPNPKDPSMSRVYYEIGTVLPGWLPRSIMNKISSKAMNDATGWVKRESERAQEDLQAEDMRVPDGQGQRIPVAAR